MCAGELIERTSSTLRTMQGLDRYQGHFYNWYDTVSLQPLTPLYVSAVDSGNLAGHLLTLRAGPAGLPDEKIIDLRLFEGLSDTLGVLADLADGPIRTGCSRCAEISTPPTIRILPRSIRLWRWLDRLARSALDLAEALHPHADPAMTAKPGAAGRFCPQCQGAQDELIMSRRGGCCCRGVLFGSLTDQPGLNSIPTLREMAQLDVQMLAVIDGRLEERLPCPIGNGWSRCGRRSPRPAGRRATGSRRSRC